MILPRLVPLILQRLVPLILPRLVPLILLRLVLIASGKPSHTKSCLEWGAVFYLKLRNFVRYYFKQEVATLAVGWKSCACKRGDFTEYIPLVPGGHRKSCLFFINVLPTMTKWYKRYMEKVIRKHTRQAPRQFIGFLRLLSHWGLSTRDALFFCQAFFVLKQTKNQPKFNFVHN